MIHAAGIQFVTPSGLALFLKRGADSDHSGTWCWPGGGLEEGETPEQAAKREASEEAGADDTINGEMEEIDSRDGFVTFRRNLEQEFTPRLNDEHSEFVWADPKSPPQPLHPGVEKTLSKIAMDEMTPEIVRQQIDVFAMDRSMSLRTISVDGRLHLKTSNISKANICPYLGKEIPDFEALGLDPNKVYKLLRCPEELAKAADTFNNIPILSKHVPVNAVDHHPELVIGATGTHSKFSDPYLSNALVFWVKKNIDGILEDKIKELSSAYRYRADMTPGSFGGEPYDGVMRDIIGNHVALVKEGRAGNDVVVGDAAIIPVTMENFKMSKALLSRKAAVLLGGAAVFLQPMLAADAQIDLNPIFKGVTHKNYKAKKPAIVAGITKAVEGKLAEDASLDGLATLLDTFDNVSPAEGRDAEPLPVKGEDDEDDIETEAYDAEPLKNFLNGKLSAEDMAACEAFMPKGKAADTPPPTPGGAKRPGMDAEKDEEDKVSKTAMDEAVAAVRKQAALDAKNLREAERFVRPWVGELAIACDSAEAVHRAALGILNIDVTGVDPSAFPAIIKQAPKPGDKRPAAGNNTAIAMDAAAAQDFAKRFPGVERIKQLG